MLVDIAKKDRVYNNESISKSKNKIVKILAKSKRQNLFKK